MAKTYLMHKTNQGVGVADLPDWVNFDEHPPRSFQILWSGEYYAYPTRTDVVVPITKEVYDIMRGV